MYPLCPQPAWMNPKKLGAGLAGLSANLWRASLRTWGLPGAREGELGSEGQLLDPPHVWASPAAALLRTLNVCVVAGSYLVFGSQGLQLKLYG